jgi:hypothetical protein
MQDDLRQRVADQLVTLADDYCSVHDIAGAIIPLVQAATLELAAEALRTAYAPGMRIRPADAADWLQQRANQVKEAGNG